MWKHFLRVLTWFSFLGSVVLYLLTHDIPETLRQADKSAVEIAMAFGATNPPQHVATYVWHHPFWMSLLILLLLAMGAGLSWAGERAYKGLRTRPTAPPMPLYIESHTGRMPTSMKGDGILKTFSLINTGDGVSWSFGRLPYFDGKPLDWGRTPPPTAERLTITNHSDAPVINAALKAEISVQEAVETESGIGQSGDEIAKLKVAIPLDRILPGDENAATLYVKNQTQYYATVELTEAVGAPIGEEIRKIAVETNWMGRFLSLFPDERQGGAPALAPEKQIPIAFKEMALASSSTHPFPVPDGFVEPISFGFKPTTIANISKTDSVSLEVFFHLTSEDGWNIKLPAYAEHPFGGDLRRHDPSILANPILIKPGDTVTGSMAFLFEPFDVDNRDKFLRKELGQDPLRFAEHVILQDVFSGVEIRLPLPASYRGA